MRVTALSRACLHLLLFTSILSLQTIFVLTFDRSQKLLMTTWLCWAAHWKSLHFSNLALWFNHDVCDPDVVERVVPLLVARVKAAARRRSVTLGVATEKPRLGHLQPGRAAFIPVRRCTWNYLWMAFDYYRDPAVWPAGTPTLPCQVFQTWKLFFFLFYRTRCGSFSVRVRKAGPDVKMKRQTGGRCSA